MELTPAFFMHMLRATLIDPRAGAAAVLRLGFAPIVGWMALLLMAVVSTLFTHFSFAMMPVEAQEFWGAAMGSPVRTAILQCVVLLISVHAIHKIGRWRGGHGTLQGAVVLVAWLQFIMLCVQIVQLLAQALAPPLADFLGFFGLVLFLWLMTNFIAELHGFPSRALVFFGMVLTLITASFILAFVFALLVGLPAEGV